MTCCSDVTTMRPGRDKIWTYFGEGEAMHKTVRILKGGRRSGKTWHALQYLMLRCVEKPGHIVSVAAMTNDQGRLGAYADLKSIMQLLPFYADGWDLKSSPLEARHANGSKMIFKSYGDSETAKGIACDDLFINEANKFSLQQYIDLKANVRDITIIDFNPNVRFWVDDLFDPSEICSSTWMDNRMHLTASQLDYFEMLKKMAQRPEATSVDKYNYSVYYLGEYADIDGAIFTRTNIRRATELPRRSNLFERADGGRVEDELALRNFAVFCDPSALRGADWFACVLSATADDGSVWIIDTFSTNTGTREAVARKIIDWCKAWDVRNVYIETNGIVGLDFYDFAENSGIPVVGWYSKGNKYQRIVDNYQNLTTQLVVLESAANDAYLEQVYSFAEKCDHDDNIDAINSAYNMQRWTS